MLVFKKIVAATTMVLSIIAVILLIVSLFGSWVVKARVETTTVALLLAGENLIDVTRGRLDQADGLLEKSSLTVDTVDQRINELSSKLTENTSVVASILEAINTDLVPVFGEAVATFNSVVDNITAINDAIDAVRDIPLLGYGANRLPDMTRLQQLEDQLANLNAVAQQFRETVQNTRTELIEGKIAPAIEFTSGLIADLKDTRQKLADADAMLAQSAEDMAALRERIPGLLMLLTILLNLIFLLSILAFVSLFIHAWQYFKCPEDGLSSLMPHECEKVPAAA